jgi:RHS repeat-associated protein
MFDEHGLRVWSVELDLLGAPRRVETIEGFDRHACPFRFQGQYEDAETGLYYNRFRYYDPVAGQYISQDPIGLLGGPRPYGYVRDPLHYVDVLGLTYTGGRHRDTSKPVNDGMDSHHMPAKATYADSALSPGDGPAIKMDPADHHKTASYGASAGDPEFDIRRQSITDARAARAAGDMDGAKRIIDDAILRDIDDAVDVARRSGDPSKYDKAIMEMLDSLDDDFYDRITREKSSPPCS